MREQSPYLLPREDARHAGWAVGALDAFDEGQLNSQHVAVEKQQRAEGMILRGGGDVGFDGQVREELADLFGPISAG